MDKMTAPEKKINEVRNVLESFCYNIPSVNQLNSFVNF